MEMKMMFIVALWLSLIQLGKAESECYHTCIHHKSCVHKRFNNTCYYLYTNDMMDWQGNKQFCNGLGLKMVRTSKNTIKYLSALNFDNMDQNGVWLDGKAVDLKKWTFLNETDAEDIIFLNMSDLSRREECGYLDTNSFLFRAQGCSDQIYYICRHRSNVKIHAVKRLKVWFEARQACIEDGGDLFYLAKDDDISAIISNVVMALSDAGISNGSQTHVGMVHRIWQWSDKSQILYTNWRYGEPQYAHEECLMMYNDGKWNDARCSSKKRPFCQGEAKTDASVQTTRPTEQTMAEVTETTAPTTTAAAKPVTNLSTSTSTSISIPNPPSSFGLTPPSTTKSVTMESTASSFLVTTPSQSEAQENKPPTNKEKIYKIIIGVLGVMFLSAVLLTVFICVRKRKKAASQEGVSNNENQYENPENANVYDEIPIYLNVV